MKTAIITGGNRGIGLDITKAFVAVGYKVIVGARHDTDIEEQFNGHTKFVTMDVQDEAGHQKLAQGAVDWTGQIDVYINNAGFSEWRPIQNIDDSFFNDLIGTNLKGAFWGCKVAADCLETDGTIINVSSIAGKRGSVNNAMYCASKFGMNGLTQALAKELDVLVLSLSQLSRAVEQRDDKKPQLADLRESGSIEQDADVVMFVYRAAYYLERKEPALGSIEHAEWQQKMDEISSLAEIMISKQRHGPTGNIKVEFEAMYTKFKDLENK